MSPIGSTVAAQASPSAGGSQAICRLTAAQLAVVSKLAATDRHVRAHEQAHLAAAGPYATGGPSYSYAAGPDGNLYAVGGEVTLDVSPDPTSPEATVAKARVIEAAANAPADPSTQDRMVAAAAAQMEATAERQISARSQAIITAYQRPAAVDLGQILSKLL